MPFDKVPTQVDFPAQERDVLRFWQEIRAFEQLRTRNRSGPRWSFLDGPITANNPMGVHHAWGRTYKDAYQRYQAMNGRHQRYQNGFDCQGLWVEVEVEKELKLRSKRDIENLVPGDRFASIDRFVRLCKERVDRFARVQTEQSIRLGYWMDWDVTDADWAKAPGERKSYFTMSEENNYTIWAFLKKCHERGLVYRGFDAMPWCPRCGVGLSEQEVKEGYRLVSHRSVFVKFPLRGRPGESLLVWTTTPWTLSSNVGAAVNPELPYLKVRHKAETFYVGKTAFSALRGGEEQAGDEVEVEVDQPAKKATPRLKTIEQLFKEKGKEGFEVVGELLGSELVGLEYDGPFDELDAQSQSSGYPEELAKAVRRQDWAPDISARTAHRVVAWKEVGATTGTGIVHIAPGCGKEDFQLGKEEGLPPVAPLDEAGVFLPGFGWLEGLSAVDPATADKILDNLKEKNRLFASELYPHSYPHCWRCKTEVLFRLVDEWFIDMKWRNEIMDVTRQVQFLPEAISGQVRELKWLEQMHDWMISKKRFWGLALPIWVDEKTGEFEVIGSREELQSRAVEGWPEFDGHTPHRPWIDKVKIRNPRTGNLMSRIPDVGNPWLDAGIVPYSTMGYNSDRGEWEKWFPADFITESFPGQFRNWFYAILAMSTMMENRPPFKVLLGHALVRDEQGDTMSKSKGNAIEFNEAADRMGADLMRWLYCRSNPAANINFGYHVAAEVRNKVVGKLWNVYRFFAENAALVDFDPSAEPVPVAERPDLDRWILSDLQKLIATARQGFEQFNVMAFCLAAEGFIDDKLSNWYLRRNRRRLDSNPDARDQRAGYQTLYTVLTTLVRLMAPVVPFVSEAMYQNLVVKGLAGSASPPPASVHLTDYPQADAGLIDEELSRDMDALLGLVSVASAARNSVKIKVRQPLAELKVRPGGEGVRRAAERFVDQLCEELNLKRVTLIEERLLSYDVKPNMRTLGEKKLGPRIKDVQAALAGADLAALAATVKAGEPVRLAAPASDLTLDAADFVVTQKGTEGWAGLEQVVTPKDAPTQVLLDVRVTPELRREGLARDVVRKVQELRKKADLQISDHIELHIAADSDELRAAVETHRSYIGGETLADRWATEPLGDGSASDSGNLDGASLTIQLRKV